MASLKLRAFKYLSVVTLPIAVWISFTQEGLITFLPLLYAFFIIPLLEVFISPSDKNLEASEVEMVREDTFYDWMIYVAVLMHFVFVIYYFFVISETSGTVELIGRISALGILCGVLGINVAHELGHRSTNHEKFMAKALLLTSLYMHFYIEHNRGHHRNVSTPEDPASSRFNESLYAFWIRSIVYSYVSAWKLEFQRLKKKGLSAFSLRNEMLQYQLIQLALLAAIYFFFGPQVMVYFLGSALVGILLLETVNYIEHYGLMRTKVNELQYERVRPVHSWNSNHIIGRLMLFELSRHSDHHFKSSKKYQTLEHHEQSPQMPTGYPGMMLLATIPPLWFSIMNKRVENYLAAWKS